MTWNTNLTFDGVTGDRVGALIVAENPDVIGLQQTRQQKLGTYGGINPNDVSDTSMLFGYLKANGWHQGGLGQGLMYEHHTTTIGTSSGITIVSRIALSGRTALEVGRAANSPSPGYDEKRHIQRALATLPGGAQFYIFNTHLSANAPGAIPNVDRRRTAFQCATGESILPPQPPLTPFSAFSRCIVCGDFNTDPGNAAGQMGAYGWAAGAPWSDADPLNTPTIPSFGAGTYKRDYILRLDGTYAGVTIAMQSGPPRVVENKISDHRPVVATVSW